ncbi:MAG: hypothetical protein IT371_29850 [Deltaproteobacteria bacterium]|nr:hypothetical protein [Deltaproteobacteria bacterium]
MGRLARGSVTAFLATALLALPALAGKVTVTNGPGYVEKRWSERVDGKNVKFLERTFAYGGDGLRSAKYWRSAGSKTVRVELQSSVPGFTTTGTIWKGKGGVTFFRRTEIAEGQADPQLLVFGPKRTYAKGHFHVPNILNEDRQWVVGANGNWLGVGKTTLPDGQKIVHRNGGQADSFMRMILQVPNF